ncbi:E3 ubiquitin-protein ligase CCNB1IP1-like isoform X1 [Macrosteles quadrilineatus]|uniref:E3 ubiquitin-protein ligase CCNB1IP1-like isoform X1 n=1 Tax=Macrosteles quadrilineatus TaxID=74068 RepID=UPI0023E2FFBC|nr:E3 ubiquitin-protein ligase CCNB1IP1-like isoform X1 [Macrosteles quadrilineatus]
MAESSLTCNYRNCKELLIDFACVTRCSHIFCINHFIQGEGANKRCYVCGAVLEGDFDVIRHDSLNPTEEEKLFLLAGYSSEVIFNIMVRAIQFWDYQTNVKVMQYKYKIENMKSFLSEKDRYIENLTLKIKQHIKKEQEKINYLKNEVEKLTASAINLEKQIEAKNRQISYMQSKYDDLHRHSMASQITQETNNMDIEELADIVCSQSANVTNKNPPPATPVFVFEPKARQTPNSRSSGSFHRSSSSQTGFLSF